MPFADAAMVFSQCDTDGDGSISAAEFRRIMGPAVGDDSGDFKRYDRDSDGRLSRSEFKATPLATPGFPSDLESGGSVALPVGPAILPGMPHTASGFADTSDFSNLEEQFTPSDMPADMRRDFARSQIELMRLIVTEIQSEFGRRDPFVAEYQYALGRMLLAAGKPADAAVVLQESLAIQDESNTGTALQKRNRKYTVKALQQARSRQ